MTQREYVIDAWLRDNGAWLALAFAVIGCVTAPETSGAGTQALMWLGASVFWFLFMLVLVGLSWRRWQEPVTERREPPPSEASAPSAEVVPLRPTPPKGLH